MKSTGMVRKVDGLGRLVIPMELRNSLELGDNQAMEIFTEGDKIIIRKFERSCYFCGNPEEIIDFKGKKICPACLNELTGETIIVKYGDGIGQQDYVQFVDLMRILRGLEKNYPIDLREELAFIESLIDRIKESQGGF